MTEFERLKESLKKVQTEKVQYLKENENHLDLPDVQWNIGMFNDRINSLKHQLYLNVQVNTRTVYPNLRLT